MAYLKSLCICLIFTLLGTVSLFGADEQSLAAAPRDQIIPNVGQLISGTFQSADENGISLALDSGATVTISWDKVQQLVLRHKVKLTTKLTLTSGCKEQIFDQPTIQVKDKTLVVAGGGFNSSRIVTQANLDSISIADEAINGSTDLSKKPIWTGSISPSASLSTGSQGQQTWQAVIDIRRTINPDASTWRHQATDLRLQANDTLATQVGSPSIRTHHYDGELTHQVYLAKSLFAEIVAYGYHNTTLNLYLEQRYGGGIGGQIFSTCRQNLTLTGNLVFVGEHFYGHVPSLGFMGATLRESYRINLAKVNGNPVFISEVITYVPAFGQSKAWQETGRADFNLPITKKLSSTLSYANDYMENAPNVRKNWSTSSVGFTYKF
jgi:hypothetical protein